MNTLEDGDMSFLVMGAAVAMKKIAARYSNHIEKMLDLTTCKFIKNYD